MLFYLIKLSDLEIRQLYKLELFIGCYYLIKFARHRYCSSIDIIILVCYEIKQDRMIKESPNYNDRSSSRQVTTLPGLGGHRHCSSGDIMVLVCHLI